MIIRPTQEIQINSFEKDLKKIDAIYQYGYQEGIRRLKDIKTLFLK